VANYHKIPFYVAAPRSTFDPQVPDGQAIPIEMRPPQEVTELAGLSIAPRQATARNPSFDVTPAGLIAGLITEYGIIRPPFSEGIRELFKRPPQRS
jgi:methylthioribose-1-phosphate isomerase